MRQEDIMAIQTMDNLILRNLKITQSYYRLAEELRDFGWGPNVSWLSFGTYASKTAGYQ